MSSENKNKEPAKEGKGKIAVIRIRGPIKVGHKKNDTMTMLKIYRKNYCAVIDNTPSMAGMLKKVQSQVTWGEIDDLTLKELISKKGEKTKNKEGKEDVKPYFRLNPPKGGFERKGIKVPYSIGGALGYRGKKINDLIRRMLP